MASSTLYPSINIVCLKWILTLHVSLELVFCAKMKRFKRHFLGLRHAAYGVHSFSSTPLLADTCPTSRSPRLVSPVVFLFGFYNKRHNNYHLNYIGLSLFRKTFQLTDALELPPSSPCLLANVALPVVLYIRLNNNNNKRKSLHSVCVPLDTMVGVGVSGTRHLPKVISELTLATFCCIFKTGLRATPTPSTVANEMR